jgi:hypothetical protein
MPKLTEEKKALVEKLAREKKTVRQIAEETGVSKTTIGTFLKNKKDYMEVYTTDSPTFDEPSVTLSPNRKINLVDTIPEGHMLDQKAVDSFLSSVTEDKSPEAFAKQTEPIKGGAFIQDILNTSLGDIPEAEHFPRPLKGAKAKVVKAEKAIVSHRQPLVSHRQPLRVKEDEASKPDLIAKIHFNVNTFEALLKDITKGDKEAFIKSLDRMSVSSLENTLKLIETTRSVKNLSNQFLHFFWIGSTMVEIGTQQYLGMKTQGFTMALQQTQQDELRLIMQEIAMEQKDKFQKVQRPEVRLAMIMTTTLLAVNTNNNIMASKQQPQQQQFKIQKAEQKPEQKPEQKQEQKPTGQQHKVSTFIPEETKSAYKDL